MSKNQPEKSYRYNHAELESRRRFLRFLLRTIGFTALARVDRIEGLENVPTQGPAILMYNHIALIDPIVVLHILPRNCVPLAKVEVYDYPLVGIFPKMWQVIPVRRGEFDRRAVQQLFAVLKAGELVLVSPEGTRNPQLLQAREGIAYMAVHSQAPLVPVAISDTIGFPTLPVSARWKGPGAHVRFGKPFRFKITSERPSHAQLRIMADEAMYILAALLPPEQRGYYADLKMATQETIEWLE